MATFCMEDLEDPALNYHPNIFFYHSNQFRARKEERHVKNKCIKKIAETSGPITSRPIKNS